MVSRPGDKSWFARCHRPYISTYQIDYIHLLRLTARCTNYGLVRPSVLSKGDRFEDLQRSISPYPCTWIRCIPCGCFFQLFIIMVCDGQKVSNSSLGPRRQDRPLPKLCPGESRRRGSVLSRLHRQQRLTTIMKGSEYRLVHT